MPSQSKCTENTPERRARKKLKQCQELINELNDKLYGKTLLVFVLSTCAFTLSYRYAALICAVPLLHPEPHHRINTLFWSNALLLAYYLNPISIPDLDPLWSQAPCFLGFLALREFYQPVKWKILDNFDVTYEVDKRAYIALVAAFALGYFRSWL